jgi:glutathione S-transferase
MLKFYYATISANSQRVWITLLEKQIPFEPIIVNLDGEQFQSEFTAIDPLQQVPAIVDNGLFNRCFLHYRCSGGKLLIAATSLA